MQLKNLSNKKGSHDIDRLRTFFIINYASEYVNVIKNIISFTGLAEQFLQFFCLKHKIQSATI